MHLADADVRELLRQIVDVVVHCEKRDGRFRISEVFFDPAAKLTPAQPARELTDA